MARKNIAQIDSMIAAMEPKMIAAGLLKGPEKKPTPAKTSFHKVPVSYDAPDAPESRSYIERMADKYQGRDARYIITEIIGKRHKHISWDYGRTEAIINARRKVKK